MNIKPCLLALSIGACGWVTTPVYAAQTASSAVTTETNNTLTQLIETALVSDNIRRQFYTEAEAMRQTGVAHSTLMDPKLRVGVTGLPVDSFEFDQDPMTNISLGIMQQFERGNTLALQQTQANQQAQGLVVRVQAREQDIINNLTSVWLELGFQQTAYHIMQQNRYLLTDMERFIQTNYGIGKSEAQDLLNAQLQVSRLDEKLQANQQMQQKLTAQLSEWLGADWLRYAAQLEASNQLDWSYLEQWLTTASTSQHYYAELSRHPNIRLIDSAIEARRTQVDLAREAYSPQFGVEVMYAYRQSNDMRGEPASDLISAYLTMDLPLFTGNRQDRNLSAAQYQVGAAQSQKDTLLMQMNAKVNALLVERGNLTQRLQRYQSTLLPQVTARVKAVERGYQNNTAQFNDVIMASNDELALQLEYQRLLTDLNQVNNNLAELLSRYPYHVTQPALAVNPAQQQQGK
ncbi:TolC family protein [Vibrio ostreae]|uniref:TolC family protein n=1 Tax=Vibrio ostreae TaxID=2841925 RepID=A0A975YP37_9VIBR|nr:TolC family protein [Vibrio ostreae]QXO18378.1 TolC family protein [Vibrio ostreae]